MKSTSSIPEEGSSTTNRMQEEEDCLELEYRGGVNSRIDQTNMNNNNNNNNTVLEEDMINVDKIFPKKKNEEGDDDGVIQISVGSTPPPYDEFEKKVVSSLAGSDDDDGKAAGMKKLQGKEEELSSSSFAKADPAASMETSANTYEASTTNNTYDASDIQPLPTAGLRRGGTNVHRMIHPGAYRMEGSMDRGIDVAAQYGRRPQNEEDSSNHSVVEEGENPSDSDAFNIVDGAVLVSDSLDHNDTDLEQQHEATPCHHVRAANEEIIDGEIMDESKTQNQVRQHCWSWLLVLTTVALVGLVVFLLVFLVVVPDDDENSKNNNQQEQPPHVPIVYPPFQDGLPRKANKVIETIGSPYYQANKWMMLDPNLSTYSEQRQRQRFLLAVFYHTLDGDNWFHNDGWLDYTVSECQWYSSTSLEELKYEPICDDDGNIRIISLASNNLQGVAPVLNAFYDVPFIPQLYAFDIAHNNVSGTVPHLHGAINTEIMVVSNNSFAALSSGWVVLANKVRILKLDSNQIEGTITADGICIWPVLQILNLTGNLLRGNIVPDYQHCPTMHYMGLGHNLFGGTIPSELGLIHPLVELDVSGNADLSGTIPPELAALPNLNHLDITETNITGEVPKELCDDEVPFTLHANCSLVTCCHNY